LVFIIPVVNVKRNQNSCYDKKNLTYRVPEITRESINLYICFRVHQKLPPIESQKSEHFEASTVSAARSHGRSDFEYGMRLSRALRQTLSGEGLPAIAPGSAGFPGRPPHRSATRELFDKVIGVNLAGPYRLSATMGERMAAGKGGS